jgi:S1-C subfamily serine protease
MMSDETTTPDLPPAAETVNLPVLRREALLPNERSRGLGTVAVVCTMAGVASGLALATTLMAMQVADTMSSRPACSYHRATPVTIEAPVEQHGFLGIRYSFDHERGNAIVDSVIPHTPAQYIGIRPGDRVLSVDGDKVDSANELQERIFNARPGSRPLLRIERGEEVRMMRPTLINWPSQY